MFVPNSFTDGSAGGTPITAATLNNLEQGVVAADITNPASAAALALAAGYAPIPRLAGSLGGASKIKPTSWTVYLIGIDTVSSVLWAQDLNNGVIRCSYDNAVTWDNSTKGPTSGVFWSTISQVIRFQGNVYCIGSPSYSATTLASAASAGASTLSITGAVTVGAMVLDYNNGAAQEAVVVTAVSGTGPCTATLAAPLVNAHTIAAAVQTGTAIYQASPPANGVSPTWTLVFNTTPGTSPKPCSFTTDGTYLIFGEYGDPRNGGGSGAPRIWRTTDGVTWAATFAPAAGNVRHIHAVEFDPYVAGSVWATTGDGVPYTVLHSTDSGATWNVAVASSNWQSVQISFDPNFVYLAGDSGNTDVTVINKTTGAVFMGSHGIHRNIAPPGAPSGTVYSANAYFGTVDPATGVFYSTVVDAATGQWAGMFYVPSLGGPVTIFDKGGDSTSWSMNGRVYVYGGYVYAGQWRAPVLTRVT